MLNTSLTVRARTAGSHQGKGWEQFTDRVIEVVDRYGGANLGAKSGLGQGVVFLAWGSWAAKRVSKVSKVSEPILALRRCSPPPLDLPLFFFSSPSFCFQLSVLIITPFS
jgi:uracil-DNA glycosylase